MISKIKIGIAGFDKKKEKELRTIFKKMLWISF